MIARFSRLLLGAVAALALTFATPAAEVGQPAPAFTLKDAAGTEHTLADWQGKVVAMIWTNPGCPFIVRHYEAGSFDKLAKQFEGQDVQVVLVDSTHSVTPESTKEAAEKFGVTLPVLQDADGATGKAYGAKTTPHVFVVNKQGMLVYAGAFDNDPQGDKPAAEQVNYTAKAIEAALADTAVAEPTTKSYGCSVKYPKEEKKEAALLGSELTLASFTPLHCGKCEGDKKSTHTATNDGLMPVDCGKCGDKKSSTTLTAFNMTPLGDGCGKTSHTALLAALDAIAPMGDGCGKTSHTALTASLMPLGSDCGKCGDKKSSTTLTLSGLLPMGDGCGKCGGEKTSNTLTASLTPLCSGDKECGKDKEEKKDKTSTGLRIAA